MFKKKIILFMIATSLAFSCVPVYATDEEVTESVIVDEAQEAITDAGIVEENAETTQDSFPELTKFSIGYFFEDGSFDKWGEFSGFSVGDCYLTDAVYSNLTEEDTLYQSAKESREKYYSNINIDMNDFNSVVENIGYAIQNETGTVRLTKTDDTSGSFMILTDGEHHDGFQVGVQEIQQGQELTLVTSEENIPVTVSELYENDGTNFISITGDLSVMQNGMPVVFKDGSVAGIITNIGTDNASVITDTSITKILDSLNLSYDISPINNTDESTIPDESVDTVSVVDSVDESISDTSVSTSNSEELEQELIGLIIRAENIDTSIYTDESVEAFNTALKEANDAVAMEGDYKKAINNLNAAMNGLVEKGAGINLTFIIFIAAIVLSVIAILIILLVVLPKLKNKEKYIIEDDEEPAKNKKKDKKAKKNKKKVYDIDEPISRKIDRKPSKRKNPEGEEEMDFEKESEELERLAAKRDSEDKKYRDRNKEDLDDDEFFDEGGRFDTEERNVKDVYSDEEDDDEDEDTSVLSDGESETSVLGDDNPSAYLIRQEDNRSIPITKKSFTIGKSSEGTDFRIRNNSAVSRRHARIIYNNGVFTITDLNSKNGTFINGAKLESSHKVVLNSGDSVTFANAEFVFRENEE